MRSRAIYQELAGQKWVKDEEMGLERRLLVNAPYECTGMSQITRKLQEELTRTARIVEHSQDTWDKLSLSSCSSVQDTVCVAKH